MAGWNVDNPWEDELPDDLPPEERWEFSIAQLADGTADEADLAEDVRREPISQRMLDRYMRLDQVLRAEASKPIPGVDWNLTADQIDQFVRTQAEAEERSMLLDPADTRSRSFWNRPWVKPWVKPTAGLAAAAAVALLVVGFWPGGADRNTPAGTGPIAGNTPPTHAAPDGNGHSPDADNPDADNPDADNPGADHSGADTSDSVLLVEMPPMAQPGKGGTGSPGSQGSVEVELVQPPDMAGVLWDLPTVTTQERSAPAEVFIGPVEQ